MTDLERRKSPRKSAAVWIGLAVVFGCCGWLLFGSESLDESIRRLHEAEGYHDPGFNNGLKDGQTNVEHTLSNHRALNVLNKLEKLPASDRQARIRELFAGALDIHRQTLLRVCNHVENPAEPQNTQSMWGTQLAVCCAMLATARAGDIQGLLDEFAAFDTLQAELEHRIITGGDKYSPSSKSVLRHYCVPDPRSQLNTIVLATALPEQKPLRDEIEPLIASLPLKPSLIYRHRGAQNSLLTRLPGQGPRTYLLLDWPSHLLHDHAYQSNLRQFLRAKLSKSMAAR